MIIFTQYHKLMYFLKGTLPMAKVGSLVTMSHSKLSEQSFHVPLFFVDSDSPQRSAGSLEVAMKYKASGESICIFSVWP